MVGSAAVGGQSRGDSRQFDPYAGRPEDALDAARKEVKRWRMEQLATVKRQHHLDPLTEWFVLAWDAFRAPRFPADEALKLARVVGLDFNRDVKNVVCEVKSSDVILWDSKARQSKGKLGPIGETIMLNTLHQAAAIVRDTNTGAAMKAIEDAGLLTDREPFVLCSSHLMRRRDRGSELLAAEDWDLVLLDEAHHARRKSPGTPQEGGPNQLLRLMHQVRPKCRSLLLLTATPMQVHPVELWDLLQLLGLSGRWEASRADFVRYFAEAAGNPGQEAFEFLAEMFRETEASFGEITEEAVQQLVPKLPSLGCRKVLKALRDQSGIRLKRLDVSQRKGAMEILRRFSPVRYRMSRHTRSLLREYFKRGLISSPIAIRDVRDVALPMTRSEQELYDAVEDYISQTYNNASPDKRSAVGFVMTIYRRRLASSFHALQQTLNNRLAGIDSVTAEDVSENEQDDEAMDIQHGDLG